MAEGRADDAKSFLQGWRDFRRDDIQALFESEPPWHAGGFGHPDHVADFDYWSKMPNFSLEETLCLSVGIEPVTPETIRKLLSADPSRLRPPIQFLIRRHEQLSRKFSSDGYESSVDPKSVLAWAEEVDFEIHPQFLAHLRQHHGGGSRPPGLQGSDAAPDRREINTIAQLFTAMVIQYYGYRPDQGRGPVPKEIADMVAKLGLSIYTDTIRKYLRIGASFLPDDFEPD